MHPDPGFLPSGEGWVGDTGQLPMYQGLGSEAQGGVPGLGLWHTWCPCAAAWPHLARLLGLQ